MPEMTEKTAFKYGFLLRCVEEGCDADETARRIDAGLAKQADGWDAAKSFGTGALALPVLGAVGLGAAGGYTLANMGEKAFDVDDARKRELIQAYDSHARQAKIRALVGKYRPPEKPSFSRF